jgi:hypothetical protein
VASASGSPTSIILPNSPAGFAAGAFIGGTLYCASTGQQVRIIGSTVVTIGNPITLTIASPLGQNGATINADGLTFSATTLGPAVSNAKFSAAVSVAADGYVPSQLPADLTGGFLGIQDIDMQGGFLFVICQ